MFLQKDNTNLSDFLPFIQNVIRGLHVSPYAKLLTCIKGKVFDVVADCRPESPTYLKWSAAILTEDNCRQILVPPHCGHGYLALTEDATVIYGQVKAHL